MAESQSSTEVERATVPAGMPQVLTRTAIPALNQDLDASDVLECYALVRSAPLHGIANSTIHVQKMAVGFRYRPPGATSQQPHIEKRPIEMTLEYGPQRVGPMLHHEAMPYIQVSDQESSFIGWENEGRVFYTTEIATETYLSSFYMASMTGAVLNKILLQAVEYAERRRRYHPFSIYSAQNGREVHSSSSVDFAQYVWKQLANLGVEIHPILPPPVYEARLWVDSWEKVIPAPAAANDAALFYQRLYQCLEAIATNDYAAYAPPTATPTLSTMPSSTPTARSTAHPTIDSRSLVPAENDSGSSSPPSNLSEANKSDEKEDVPRIRTFRKRRRAEGIDTDDESLDDDDTWDDDNANEMDTGEDARADEKDGVDPIDDVEEILPQSSEPTTTNSPTISPAPVTPDPIKENVEPEDKVEEAKQAAADAQQAADEAKNAAHTEGDTKAADAAQNAATAAQAAADATSNAATKAAMEGLLSGDGNTMAAIATQCLTRDKYGIASVDENGTVTVNAFLYREGTNYYKLNLTSPYIEIAKINRPLPSAATLSSLGAKGELVDFVLAFLVMTSIFLLVVVILQQMGYECFQSLFRCQRWFFNPRKYDYEGNKLDSTEGGFDSGEDGIPLSMGGRVSKISQSAVETPAARSLNNNGSQTPISIGSTQELEMRNLSGRRRLARTMSDHTSQGSLSGDELGEDLAVVPQRLYRDPDLVDMPHLKSTSKVAIPVGSNQQTIANTGHPDEVEYSFDEYS